MTYIWLSAGATSQINWRGYNLSGLSDLPQDPRQRHVDTAGRINAGLRSPIQGPIEDLFKKPADVCGCLSDYLNALPSKGSRGFLRGGNVVAVPNSGSSSTNIVAVASLNVAEGYEAILQRVGWEVVPNGDYASIIFQLKIAGEPEPYFSSSAFLRPTMANPLEFHLEIPPGKTLELVATNSSGNMLSAMGFLCGFIRPRTA